MLAIVILKCARMIFNRLLKLFYLDMQVVKNTIQIKLVHFGELLAVDFVSLNIGLQDCLLTSNAISIRLWNWRSWSLAWSVVSCHRLHLVTKLHKVFTAFLMIIVYLFWSIDLIAHASIILLQYLQTAHLLDLLRASWNSVVSRLVRVVSLMDCRLLTIEQCLFRCSVWVLVG